MKEAGATFIVARELGWGLYLRGLVTRTGKALPNKLLIAAILNKIPFKPNQNKLYNIIIALSTGWCSFQSIALSTF